MLATEGGCSKCRAILTITDAGLKCGNCGRSYHGRCFETPHDHEMMEELVIRNKRWLCPRCFRKGGKVFELRTVEEMKEITNKLATIREVRELVILIETALLQLTNQCEELSASAVAIKNENDNMKRRIHLHELHGTKVPVTFREWRLKRKLLGVTDKHTQSRYPEIDEKKSSQKIKNLVQTVKKKKLWKKVQEPKMSIAISTTDVNELRELPAECFLAEHVTIKPKKKAIPLKTRIILYCQNKLTHFTEGPLILFTLLILVFMYTMAGAAIFSIVEGSYEASLVNEILAERRILIKNSTTNNETLALSKYYDFLAEKFGNHSKLLVSGDKVLNWNFIGSIYFCGTTYTTIGFGDIAPVTQFGKIFTMVYAMFGTPLFLVLLTVLGRTFAKIIRCHINVCKLICCSCCAKRKSYTDYMEEEHHKAHIPVMVFVCVDIVYVMIGAWIFTMGEDWEYFESFYFVMVTLLTVGLGDYVLTDRAFMLTCVAYIIIGLALTSLGITLITNKLKRKFNVAAQKLGEAVEELDKDEMD